MNQVAESVVSLVVAEAEAEGLVGDEEENEKGEKEQPPADSVEEEVIQAVEEVKLGDTGVSGAFVKQALQGKEIIFVIGEFLPILEI